MDIRTLISIIFVLLIPVLVALTNMFTNIVKGFGAWFVSRAKIIAPIVAEILTLACTVAYLQITGTAMTWYWIAGGAAIGGIVAYVAMFGYDALYEELVKYLHGGKAA